jgi:hypothetical protein
MAEYDAYHHHLAVDKFRRGSYNVIRITTIFNIFLQVFICSVAALTL